MDAYWSDDPSAIKQGYNCLHPVVLRYLKSCFHNLSEDQVADAMSETLLKIHQAGQKLVVEYCSTWVRTVARNAAITLFRKERRHMDERESENQLAFDGSDTTLALDDMVDQIQRIAAIEDVFKHLKEGSDGKDDQVIIRGLVNGYSYKEIGRQIGRTEGAVATRTSLIRKKLQAVYETHFNRAIMK